MQYSANTMKRSLRSGLFLEMMVKIMKKWIVLLFSIFALNTMAAEIQTCEVVQMIDSSIFEESLSIEEYPNVTIEDDSGTYIARIGSNVFGDNGDYIVKPANMIALPGAFAYEIQSVKNKFSYFVSGEFSMASGKPGKTGRVEYVTKKGALLLAELVCK